MKALEGVRVLDLATLFAGPFGSNLSERLDKNAVLALLDSRNVRDEYIRRLALVALKRAAQQAGG